MMRKQWFWDTHADLAAAAAAKSLQSCLTLCDATDGSPPGVPVPKILQARTLEWIAISFSNAWKGKVKVKPLSCVRLFVTPRTDCSLPGCSVHGIFQARVLDWLPWPSPIYALNWKQFIIKNSALALDYGIVLGSGF